MRNLAKFLVLAILALVLATRASAQVTWTFSDVFFSNGNELTGTFTTNSAADTILSVNAAISGPVTAADFTVVSMSSAYLATPELGLFGPASPPFPYADLYPSTFLTGAGGTISLTSGFNCPGCGTLETGSGYDPTITTTPEPSTAGLMVLGFTLLLGTRLVMRGRRTTSQA